MVSNNFSGFQWILVFDVIFKSVDEYCEMFNLKAKILTVNARLENSDFYHKLNVNRIECIFLLIFFSPTRNRTVDEWLPKALLDGAQSILTLTGSIVITATVSPYFLIPVLVMGLIFVYIRKVYLKTSKNIKRIEGIGN